MAAAAEVAAAVATCDNDDSNAAELCSVVDVSNSSTISGVPE